MHMNRIKSRIRLQQQLWQKLESISQLLQSRQDVAAEQFIQAIEVITMTEKHPFTPEQMEAIKKRGEQLGEETIQNVQQEWPMLIEKVRAEMEKGTSPAEPEVQQLAKRWKELIDMYTGGDPGIVQSLQQRYNEPSYAAQFGLDQAIFEYIGKAMPKS